MEYVLTREGAADDPRLARIHTPDEVVLPSWAEGVWTARCRSGAASVALQSRRYGFALIEEIVEERDTAIVYRPPPPYDPSAVLAKHGFRVHAGEPGAPPPEGPEKDWRAWQRRRRVRPGVIDAGDLAHRLRAKVDPALLQRAGEVARLGAWSEPSGEEVAIVKVMHGWGEREERAVIAALDSAAALGPGSRVIVVQNDPTAHAVTRAWEPRANAARLSVVTTRNDGFAAACNAGAKVARKARWLLFTQPDARWGPEAVRDAIGVARAFTLPPVGFGAPAIVGPSGGYVDDYYSGGVREFGRNVARHVGLPPTPVDWIAGYWLLVDGATFRKAGGWCEGFFLYFEDPDLSLRCALAGARPIAWPGLAVEHERGGTIRARVSDAVVSEMQGESRATFGARWGGR
jgi:hypothetical protein